MKKYRVSVEYGEKGFIEHVNIIGLIKLVLKYGRTWKITIVGLES